jgi:hypothetical protein
MTPADEPPIDDASPTAPENEAATPTTSEPGPTKLTEDQKIAAAKDEDLDKFNDEDVVRVRAYDPMMLVVAGSFGSSIPGAVANTHANLIWTVERQGQYSISNGGGSLESYFREQFDMPEAGKSDKDDDDGWDQYAEIAEERHERMERERKAWEESSHSYAGVEMTGAEWGEFAKKLNKDTELGQWLTSQMKKDGKTDEQSDELLRLMRLKAEMQSLPEDQWNDEQKAAAAKLKESPDLAKQVEDYTARGAEYDGYVSKISADKSATVSEGATDVSTMGGADLLSETAEAPKNVTTSEKTSLLASDDEPLFASAPDLGEHHRASLRATEPLDVPKQIAALTPPPRAPSSPGGGLDV